MSKHARVLYLEGNDLDRQAFLQMVRQKALPWEITVAPTLGEARAQLARARFDVIVADNHLPDGESPELFGEIPDIPFVLVTRMLEEQLALRTLARGADDCLVKDAEQHYLEALPFAVEKTLYRKTIHEHERRLTRALRDSEQRLRATFHNAASGIARTDEQDRLAAVNDHLCQMLGYRRQELLGKSVLELTYPEDRPRSQELNAQLREGRLSMFQYEKRYLKKDGSPLWVHVGVSAVRDEAGRYLYSVATSVDIAPRKAAEAELASLAEFPAENPQPVLRLSREGQVLYANKGAVELLEHEGWQQGAPLPAVLRQPVEAALRSGGAREFEFTRRDQQAISFLCVAVADKGYINLYGRDVSDTRRVEAALRDSQQAVQRKLHALLSPEGDVRDLELADIIDVPAVQEMMELGYKLMHIPMGILDLNGRVLVGAGWQEICTEFHRRHPGTCQYCLESDTQLTVNVPPGQSRLYRCKNNIWDMATPILVGGRHVGHLLTGQFFFKDETLDREVFRAQARRYGFDEEKYLAALDAVPRLSRQTVQTGMSYFVKLAEMLSQLSYSNIKLARAGAAATRLAAIVESSQDAILAKSLEGTILTWNQGAQRMFGYPPEQIIGQSIMMLVPPPRREEEAHILEELRQGQRLDNYDTERRAQDGHLVAVSVSVSPLRDAEGRLTGASTIMRDITERKRLEEQLQAATLSAEWAKQAAERANKAKDHFLAVLSHELRNPLTPVLPALAALEGRVAEEDREYLEMARRNVELEARLIDDLLDVTRIARGKIELQLQQVDLGTVIRRAAEVCAPDIQARLLHFGIHIVDGPYVVQADPARLQQVFWNLIKNAIKFTPHGGCVGVKVYKEGQGDKETRGQGEEETDEHRTSNTEHPSSKEDESGSGLPVSASPPAPRIVDGRPLVPLSPCLLVSCPPSPDPCPLTPASTVTVEVHDSGMGIEAEALSRIFDAFEQESRSTTRQFGGLGLGLAISKALVDMHGGSIAAYSEGKGQGATFTVRLPLVSAPAAELPPGTAPPAPPAEQSHPATPLRILLVEDHGDTARIMSRLLQARGHQVQHAGDVATALELATSQPFDLLISDLGLPDGNGHDLMRDLIARGQRLPAIALSGYGMASDVQQSRSAGFAEHVTKPVNLDRLSKAIATVTSARSGPAH